MSDDNVLRYMVFLAIVLQDAVCLRWSSEAKEGLMLGRAFCMQTLKRRVHELEIR